MAQVLLSMEEYKQTEQKMSAIKGLQKFVKGSNVRNKDSGKADYRAVSPCFSFCGSISKQKNKDYQKRLTIFSKSYIIDLMDSKSKSIATELIGVSPAARQQSSRNAQ